MCSIGDTGFLALLVYVDDIVVMSNNMHQIAAIKAYLHDKFKTKDLGELKYFLGLEVACSKTGIHLCQKKFAFDLLKDSGFLVSTPMMHDCRLLKEGTLLADTGLYRRLVGKLLYLTITCLDIAFSIQQLSQFLDCPTNDHIIVTHKVLRDIKGSVGQGLFYIFIQI